MVSTECGKSCSVRYCIDRTRVDYAGVVHTQVDQAGDDRMGIDCAIGSGLRLPLSRVVMP
jgi:hypothetical protein